MLERRRELRLSLEAREPFGGGFLGGTKDLDRHLAPEADVFGAVDDAHATFAKLVEQPVV
jgi:hypothetical protein